MSNSPDRVEVFAGIKRRRRYTAEQKLAVVQESARPGMTISYVARLHGIAPSLIFGWRRRMSEGGKEAIRADDEVVSKAEVLALQKQIRELQRVLGKKTLESEILREAVKLTHEKKLPNRSSKPSSAITCMFTSVSGLIGATPLLRTDSGVIRCEG